MRVLLVSGIACLLFGCAQANMVSFQIDSNPRGAQIDVNGVSVGNTPTNINLQCNRHWVGLAFSPDGWGYENSIYEVIAYPSGSPGGFSQTKKINPCQIKEKSGKLFFNLSLDEVTPRQRIDININDKYPKRDDDLHSTSSDDVLKNLKVLRDKGIITEEEYRSKVDKYLIK